MTYCEMITASKTWSCPKAGRWKIICVGGGASGGIGTISGTAETVQQNAGGTTSFGSYLSALGGTKDLHGGNYDFVGGHGGYTGISYGGAGGIQVSKTSFTSPVINGGLPRTTGIGYGAGGGSSISGSDNRPISGKCGEFKCIELDLTAGQSIACTIGVGGAAIPVSTNINMYATAGNSGVIVVRFIQ